MATCITDFIQLIFKNRIKLLFKFGGDQFLDSGFFHDGALPATGRGRYEERGRDAGGELGRREGGRDLRVKSGRLGDGREEAFGRCDRRLDLHIVLVGAVQQAGQYN